MTMPFEVAMRPVVSFWAHINDKAWVRIYINDVPLYRSPHVGPDSRSGPLNYLLKPGENELKIEVLKQGRPAEGEYQDNAVIFQVYTVKNMDAPPTEKLDRDILLDVRFPKIMVDTPKRHQHFPLYHRQVFHLDMDLATPKFVAAPETDFDCAGTPELRAAVQRLHDVLEAGDYDALMNELALKFSCDELVHEGDSDRLTGVRIKQWQDELLKYEPRPDEPLDMSMIHFEPRCGGRVAYVTRHDEQFVLNASCRLDPKRRIRTDLLMVQHQGRWRVFA